MSSWSNHSDSRDGWPVTNITNTSNHPSPGRREHAVQPPPLTTALNGHQFQGLGVGLGQGYAPTPISSTSLSSPFIQQSPCVASPGGAAMGPSSMASRPYNVPYNPRDWGPMSSSSSGGSTAQSPYPQSSTSNNMQRRMHPREPHPGLFFLVPPRFLPSPFEGVLCMRGANMCGCCTHRHGPISATTAVFTSE